MHLVGFIIRICHDARSLERKKKVRPYFQVVTIAVIGWLHLQTEVLLFLVCLFYYILRVSSVKTQLIYCHFKWRHVSTHRVIIRQIIEPFKVHQVIYIYIYTYITTISTPIYVVWQKSNETGNAVHEPTMLLPPPSHVS